MMANLPLPPFGLDGIPSGTEPFIDRAMLVHEARREVDDPFGASKPSAVRIDSGKHLKGLEHVHLRVLQTEKLRPRGLTIAS
ncbi:Uncharacterised protein [Starkeya nomas]|uniref:Uncharacterized protein n=1 Tax=Starkeya nomas TaxID=2666134 RepID=A0A5S9Q415_9HYPH|nr:Uncharacterised protein [Starkeya nomas]